MKARVALVSGVLAAASGCERYDDTTPSWFSQETNRERSILGVVRSGDERVASALVYLSPGATLGEAGGIAPLESDRTQTTDVSGRYFFRVAPMRYDLTIRTAEEVLLYRDVGARVIEPSLAWQAPPRVFTCRLEAAFTQPVPAGTTVEYFLSGESAVSITGGGPIGLGPLAASFRVYSSILTVHAVAHPTGEGLAHATAYGRADVRVRDGASFAFPLELVPIDAKPATTEMVVAAPPGVAVPFVEVEVDLGLRTSARPVTTVAPGASLTVSPIPGARWIVHAHASTPEGETDSGRRFFDPFAETTRLALPAFATMEGPADGADLDADDALVASPPKPAYPGVPAEDRVELDGFTLLEHVLEPEGDGRQPVRVVTNARASLLPNLGPVGLSLRGAYRWSVQAWPDLKYPEQLTGSEARIVLGTSRTAPRRIFVR